MPKKKTDEIEESTEAAVEETAAETAVADAPVEAAAEEVKADTAEEAAGPKKAAPKKEKAAKAEAGEKKAAKPKKEAKADDPEAPKGAVHKRAEKIGVVASDKMTKTVTVRVDRLVKHPIYRKYVRKRKKFMAHDELGAKIGDKVRIVETRPLSARKRWRVVEILQKAEL